jgi:hypothetical protein
MRSGTETAYQLRAQVGRCIAFSHQNGDGRQLQGTNYPVGAAELVGVAEE